MPRQAGRTFVIRHFINPRSKEEVVTFGLRGKSGRLLPLAGWTIPEKSKAHLIAEQILGVLQKPTAINETRVGGGGGYESHRGAKAALVFTIPWPHHQKALASIRRHG